MLPRVGWETNRTEKKPRRMRMKRRLFLKASLATGEIALLAGAGLLTPLQALASWPTDAFHADSLSAAMSGLLGSGEITPSDQIEIDTNEIAENGSVVPIEVRSAIPDTQAISLFASKNPFPALAEFTLTPDVDPVISCRIKLAETGEVIVVVAAGGKLYSAKRPVKVTAGGCGG